ncbi:hypothetical protein BSF41_40730 [Flavobacterium sp. ACN2]|jgi:hypothetical protein|uniref:hypothetical protein n=1 Tax=Flavobacterium sp. ACN2 TaxID=1975676 RepID=UPI000BB30767|nr:hypothetical protein [Flavobacterium sp. ACN2]PBI84745.1 hypothetical protein BSF41_40730 [Flavobacterium sp. ACN2]
MSTNHNRIKVADLETNEPDKILKTNGNGELEFSDISQKESDPVSATTSGIVNNTALQELGGVDKTINGLRIGKGNNSMTRNTALGLSSLEVNTTGDFNTAIGWNSLKTNTTGASNTAVGVATLFSNTEGINNTALGRFALYYNTTGQSNTAIGYSALTYNTSGIYNTAVGNSALYKNTGSLNTALGFRAGGEVTTGSNNILLGFQAGRALTTGIKNLLIENTVNDGVKTGSRNTILNPSQNVTGIVDGNNNTIIGGVVTSDVTDHIILGTGYGLIGFISDNTGLTRVPRQTNPLITGDTTGKAIITKEYLATSLPSLTTAKAAPTSATATGVKGDIRIDNDYVYVCVNTNTWKRSALTTW